MKSGSTNAGAIRAEVEKHDAVVRLHRRAAVDHGRDNEFVGDAGSVRSFHRAVGARGGVTGAVNHGGIRFFDTIPRKIAIHRVIAAGNRRDFADADLVQLVAAFLHIMCAGLRRHVAAVGERVDIHFLQPAALRQLHQPEQVVDVAVDAAVGQQPHQVQRRIVRFAVFHRGAQRFVIKKVAVADRFGDAHQHLVHHAAGTDVGVADFAVAHLAVRQTDVQPRRADGGVRIFRKQAGQVGRLGCFDRVAAHLRVDPETVHDAQYNRFFHNPDSFLPCTWQSMQNLRRSPPQQSSRSRSVSAMHRRSGRRPRSAG